MSQVGRISNASSACRARATTRLRTINARRICKRAKGGVTDVLCGAGGRLSQTGVAFRRAHPSRRCWRVYINMRRLVLGRKKLATRRDVTVQRLRLVRQRKSRRRRLFKFEAHALAERMLATGIRVDQALTVQWPTLETLLEEARRLGADLLILGSHQHNALYRLWYGDIAIDAVKQAPCALLVVPM